VLRVKAQRTKPSSSIDSKEAVAVLAALAQETRLAIFRHLVVAGDDGDTAGAIANALEVPGPTLSFHLKELERASIISSRRESRQIYYKANFAGMRALIEFLTDDCCGGHPDVCFGSKRRVRC
jgi:DNA-binding transcriptional ArsR family regulator